MSRTASSAKTAGVRQVDPVWSRIRGESEEIAAKDPSLGGFIFSTILNHSSFEEALCYRLSQQLDHVDVCAELVVQAFEDALVDAPDIGDAARADVVAVFERDPACFRYVEPLLYFKGFQALQIYRMAHRLWHMGRKDFAFYLQSRCSQMFTVDIHPAARIGRGIMIDHGHNIVIGETAEIGDDCSLLHSVTLGGTGKAHGDRHPKVRRGVLIGAGAKILGNIEVGACARVASGSVVLHDVPAHRTVAGVPAKVVGFAGCDEPALVMDHTLAVDEDKSAK